MADISKITLPNGSSYDFKDATARSNITNLTNAVNTKATIVSNGTMSGVDVTSIKGAGVLLKDETTGTVWNVHSHGDTLRLFNGSTEKVLSVNGHTHTKSQITDFPTSLPANGGTADTAKNLLSFVIPYNRPVASGGSGKQWIKFAEVVDNEITTASRWYSRALEFEIFNNGYGSNGGFVSMGRVSLCVSVHNQKTFTKEAITIKWQNCKPNAYTINHIVAVATDTKVEFFVLNDVWDTALTFVITRDIGIAYGSTYTSTQYTSDDFATYYSDKKIIQGSLDTNLYVYNSTKVNNHTVETDVPANAKFTDTNTWRGIQNNLTSDSTTDSLSAAQGKVLKGLVDGKAASSHTHTKSQITDFPTSLPANGGNATTVNSHTVNSDVPANAKFTDTVYTLPAATSSTLGGVKTGSNITNSSGTISLTKANVTAALGYTPPTTNTTYGVATQSTNGLMSAADKTKLDGISGNGLRVVIGTYSYSKDDIYIDLGERPKFVIIYKTSYTSNTVNYPNNTWICADGYTVLRDTSNNPDRIAYEIRDTGFFVTGGGYDYYPNNYRTGPYVYIALY